MTTETKMRVVGRWVIGLAILALFVSVLQAVVLAVVSLFVALGYLEATARRLRRHR